MLLIIDLMFDARNVCTFGSSLSQAFWFTAWICGFQLIGSSSRWVDTSYRLAW